MPSRTRQRREAVEDPWRHSSRRLVFTEFRLFQMLVGGRSMVPVQPAIRWFPEDRVIRRHRRWISGPPVICFRCGRNQTPCRQSQGDTRPRPRSDFQNTTTNRISSASNDAIVRL